MKSYLFNFKNLIKKYKNLQNFDIFKIFFAIFLFIFIIFVILNENNIQYFLNGFNSLSNFQCYVLDVGQASSTVLVFPDKSVFVVDTGSVDSAKDMISQMDYIFSKNKIKDVDCLILTHSDADHVGGTTQFLEKYQVNQILRPKILSESEFEVEIDENYLVSTTVTYSNAITSIYKEPNCQVEFIEDTYFDKFGIEIFAPVKDFDKDTNYCSPFIKIEYAGKRLLLTGDATDEREKEFMQANAEEKYDFLLVAHHGSKYSSSIEFLEFVSPTYALISAGDNTHPSQEVVSRLKSLQVKGIFCTKTDGLIGISVFSQGNLKICSLRNQFDFPLLVTVVGCGIFVILGTVSRDKRKIPQLS